MHPILFRIGSFEVSSYGVALATAMLVGIFLAKRRAPAEGLSPSVVDSVSVWIILSAIVGARFLYTFVEHWSWYSSHPWEFFSFRKGGLSFFGGLIFAIAASFLFCRKRGISFWTLADTITPSIALGLAIAKFGCFFVGCCHGSPCDLPWAVTYTDPSSLAEPKGIPLHPAQLYEASANVLIFWLLILLRRFRRRHGELLLIFLILYGAVRSGLEFFRGAPGHLAGLTTAQFLSIPLGLSALALLLIRRIKRPAGGP